MNTKHQFPPFVTINRLLRSLSTAPNQPPSASVGRVVRLNHIAVATPDSEPHAAMYKRLFNLPAQPEHGVYTTFIDLGNTAIELLEELGENGPIAGFMKKNPRGGVHHFCFEVDNLEAVVANLKAKGIQPLSPPKIGAHGVPVVFLHPKDCHGILVELEQQKQ